MIENYNESKSPFEGEVVEYKKYIGVGSVNVLAVNPSNDTLRKYGWNIPEEADEPKYVFLKERDGKQVKSARIRLLVQIQDLDDKPIIPMDYWIGPEPVTNGAKTKAQVIDSFGRTAWGDIESEIKKHLVPQYTNGPASISSDYELCHRGQDALVQFIFKYLNITPLQRFDRNLQDYVDTKNPGKFKFDKWMRLCDGDVSELESYLKLQPQNCVKVVFGISTDDNNKSYQTFLNTYYLGNANKPNKEGVYPAAQKAIDRYMDRNQRNEVYSAAPIKPWTQVATEAVADNSMSMFDESGNFLDTFPED